MMHHFFNITKSLAWALMVAAILSGQLLRSANTIVSVDKAEFGVEQYPGSYLLISSKKTDVTSIMRAVLQTYGCIAIPDNQVKFYAKDPAPGQTKVTILNITERAPDGSTLKTIRRAPQGTDYVYPAGYPGGATIIRTLENNMNQAGYIPPQ